MGEVESFFFDTYALYETVHNSNSYSKYLNGELSLITTKLNLMELYYSLLRVYGKEKAEESFNFFKGFCVEIDDEILKQASEFRFANYKRDLSYVDCIGYILAKRRGVKFLTGDEQFKKFDNVEFVK